MKLIFYETKFNRYSITTLAALLETAGLLDSIEVEIRPFLSLPQKNKNHDTVLHCFSFCTPQVKEVENFIKNLKNFEGIFVAGGPHPSGAPEETLKMGFDVVFIGEAERSFPEFIKRLIQKESFNDIKGIGYLKNGVFTHTGKPDRVDLNQYISWSLNLRRFAPLEITRGCPFACKFCQTSYLFGTKPRHRKIATVLEYVEYFLKQGMRDLRFITPNALSYGSSDGKTVNLSAVEELLSNIKKTSSRLRIFFGSFPSEVRPEHLTKEAVKLLKQYVSNRVLTIGAQSGSERILEKINRQHTVEDIYNAVKNAVTGGFSVNVDFIFGLPEETEKDQLETVKLMDMLVKIGEKKNITVKIHSHYFMPLAGTPFANKMPSKLSKKLTQFIGRLYNLKTMFGQWHIQSAFAHQIRLM